MFCEGLVATYVDQDTILAGFCELVKEDMGWRKRGGMSRLKERLSTF